MKSPMADRNGSPSDPSFADIIDFLPDATFAIDLNGTVIAWNQAIAKLTGVSSDDMLGQGDYAYAVPFYFLRRPILIDLALQWNDEYAAMYKFIRKKGETLESETENPPFRPEPSLFWNKACKIYNSEGNCIGAIEIIRDITEIRMAERIQCQYDILTSQCRDIILFIEPDTGRILDANDVAVETYGYPHEQLLSMSVWDLRTAADKGVVDRQMAEADKSGLLFETRHRKKDNRIIDVEVSSRGATLGGQRVLVSTIRDITERKRSERRLRRRELELKLLNERLEQKVLERTVELERRNLEIRELAHKTIQAMENDRKALSKELHDSIGGTLAAIKNQLEGRVEQMSNAPPEVFMPLEKVIEYLAMTIKESKRITKQLRPLVLDDFGLAAAVEEHIRDFEVFHPKVKVVRRIRIAEDLLSGDIKTVLYRVLQEALNNVGKHSDASSVEIRMGQYKQWIKLRVKDDGVGFNTRTFDGAHDVLTGYGLHSMRERVEICKGTFQIKSASGKGTMLIAVIPLDPDLRTGISGEVLKVSA